MSVDVAQRGLAGLAGIFWATDGVARDSDQLSLPMLTCQAGYILS